MSVVSFNVRQNDLILHYRPKENDWVYLRLEDTGEATIKRAFHVTRDLLMKGLDEHGEFDPLEFKVGERKGKYFHLNRDVLRIDYDLYFSQDIQLENRHFVAERDISVFSRLNKFGVNSIHIGGEEELVATNAISIPTDVFERLIADFPTSTEVSKYALARIDSIVGEYLNRPKDFQADFEKYRNKKRSIKGSMPRTALAEYEADKYSALIKKLEQMLNNVDAYSEGQWRDEILEVVLLLFPRYIKAFPEGPVNDSWANKRRRVDFLLVDSAGFIDIIEIKKPFRQKLVSPYCYRDNHVPMRELNGTVMQVEKYIYHLSRWGERGEEALKKRYLGDLPQGFVFRIVNPKATIIVGRDNDLTANQRNDFEVIRRKYGNVLDIITYDDLLRRLNFIKDQFCRLATSKNSS